MPHTRNFDVRTGPPQPPAGTFTLAGREWTLKPRKEIPFVLFERLTEEAPEGPPDPADDAPDEEKLAVIREKMGVARRANVQTREFFSGTLVPKEVDAFQAILSDPKTCPAPEVIGEIVQYIQVCIFTEEKEVPTRASGPKSPGRKATGRTSAASSRSRVTPPKASKASAPTT